MDARLGPLLVPAVVAAGGLLGVQGRINGELGRRIHSPLDAATVSFTGGTLLLLLLVAATHRDGARRLRSASTSWWWWLGGLAGAAVVGSTAAGVPKLGVALVSVCTVAGTAVGALGVDELGLGPGGRQSLDRWRLAGAALAVVAVGLGAAGDRQAAVRPLLFVALFVAGAASAVQQAANGRLRAAARDTAVASLVSFATGTVALLALTLVTGEAFGRRWPHPAWLYVGGALGTVYIATAAATVRRLGVLVLSLATVAGQLVAAVVLDLVWPAPGTHLHPATVVGAVLTLLAVSVSGRRRRTAMAAPA